MGLDLGPAPGPAASSALEGIAPGPAPETTTPTIGVGSGSQEIDNFAQSVPKGDFRPFTNSEGATVRRYFGGDAKMGGEFWTTRDFSSSSEAKTMLNLPSGLRGTNTAQYMEEGFLPSGNNIMVGRILMGATQIQIEDPLAKIIIWGLYSLPE